MTEWIAIAEQEPPEMEHVAFGWWFAPPNDNIAWWEVSAEQEDCATHFCVLPEAPRYVRKDPT